MHERTNNTGRLTAARRLVITEYDQESIAVEQEVAAARGVELLRADCRNEDDLISAASGAAGLVVQYARITSRVLEALPDLKVISRYGVGVDTVDVEAATRRRVAVCNVPDYGTEDVSDHAVALALALARGVVRLDRGLRRGDHSLSGAKPLHRISGRVFGVVGLGLIGAATARKAHGLGYSVIGCDPLKAPGTVTDAGVRVVSFDDLLARADVISLHVPLNAHTRHLIDAEALSRVERRAVLVNTCRGGVVDTAALVDALDSGRLLGAGLDVFEEEPLPASSPLAQREDVVLTPHAAWYSEESEQELKRRVLENAADVLDGRRPRNVVNPQVLA
ncbi:C-terminal binding protein [Kineococcus arenarius]|uniref:C-terminal binding protein n=1 Tax=unclassified Kineococcus TaxID=2621656 RepID=UPI003D7C7E23